MGFFSQDNTEANRPMGTTSTGYGGKPCMSSKEAFLSGFSDAHGQYTDSSTGKVYTSERAMMEDRWRREHGD